MSIDAFLRQLFPNPDPSGEPTARDWAGAQATDMANTGKVMLGGDDSGYKPFGNTMQMRERLPATFDQRFEPANQQPLRRGPSYDEADDPNGTNFGQESTDYPDEMTLPPGAGLRSGPAGDLGTSANFDQRFAGGPMPPNGVPMPPPRPDIESILAGRNANAAGGPMPMPPPPGADGGGGNMLERLSGRMTGWRPGGGTAVPTPEGVPDNASGLMGRALGFDAPREKRVRSAIAGGFAGANPAFGGGAFMKGAGGALGGGLKSDKDDLETETAASDKAQKQSNFERSQTDKEKNSEALRKLYGDRGASYIERAKNPGSAGRRAWDKPPHERLKEVERLLIDKQKQLYGGINPLAPKTERDAAKSAADKELGEFKKRMYRANGFDERGEELPGSNAIPNATPSGGSGGMRGGGSYQDPHIPESQEQFDKIKPGTYFINPSDGEIMKKKGAANTSALDDTSGEDAA